MKNNRNNQGNKDKIVTKNELKMVINEQLQRRINKAAAVKYIDVGAFGTASTSVTFVLLTSMAVGGQQSQRIADTIKLIRAEVRYTMDYSFTGSVFAQDVFDNMRFGMISWKENTASVTPTSVDVFENTGSFGILTPFCFEKKKLYARLWEPEVRTLVGFSNSVAGITAVASNSAIADHATIDLQDRLLKFNLGASTGTGHLYFYVFSDSGTTPHPNYNVVFRIYYTDVSL